ncbi:MAG: arylsulfatase [Bacteroidia bacterium]
MRFSSFFLPTAFLLLTACTPTDKPADQQPSTLRPNIIYIMADDLGYGDIGAYGQQVIRTPHIDQLAQDGMLFTDHYAGTSVCAPSRCVLMTGRHMGHAAIRGNKQHEPSGQIPLPAAETTVAELLQQAGYATGMIGKWGLGEPGTEGDPQRQGWDYYFGYTDQVLAHNYWPEFLWENGQKVMLPNRVTYLDSLAWHKGLGSVTAEKVAYAGDLFTERALAFLDRHRDSAFFLYLPYTAPHDNGEAPAGAQIEVPDYGRFDTLDWPSDQKGYAAVIERLDDYVGQIRAKVAALGLADRTLIVFTSDNGPLPERRGFTAFFDSNGPLRGGKRDLYEGGMRTPLIACWPGTIAPGSRTGHISGFQDFLPTACELAGAAVPAGLDGISYLPTLRGAPQPAHAYLYWEFHEGGGSQALRRGQWKAVRKRVNSQPQAPWELYDLSTDLGETRDVAAAHPGIVAELAALADMLHRSDTAWPLLYQEFEAARGQLP